MFSGYNISHPAGGSGLARWQQNPGGATTPNAQALAQGTTPDAAPAAGTRDTHVAPAGAPPVETPGARAARIAGARAPAPPPAAPPPQATLRPPPATPPPPTSLAPPPAAPAPAPYVPRASDYQQVPAGFVQLGEAALRAPLNMDGTPLSGAQLAALAGTGRPGDPFTGGYAPTGGWNAGNGGRSAEEQAAAVAAYKAQYGNPSVTADQVLSSTSNDPNQVEAARQAYQAWVDSVGRFQ